MTGARPLRHGRVCALTSSNARLGDAPLAKSQLDRDVVVALLPALALLALLIALGGIDALPGGVLAALLVAAGIWLQGRWRWAVLQAPVKREQRPPLVSQEFLEAISDPVIVLDGARRILAINVPARDVLGIGTLGRDLAMSFRHPEVLAAVDTLSAGVPSISEEITLPVPIARTFTFQAARLPTVVRADGQHAEGDQAGPWIVLILHDETRAKRAEQTQADFVANASHELRSPLSALIGIIETLRGPAADDAAARERFLSIMQAESGRMARLVDDLMSLSRVEINEHVAPREAVDVEDVLAGVAATLSVRAAARDMVIEVRCPPDLPSVRGDADQLTQVFHNLLDNAVKYGPPGSAIEITATMPAARPGGGHGGDQTGAGAGADTGVSAASVAVSVRDRGEGIAAIHLPRITERFYRVDQGRSRRLGGTGLGLAIVKHIVSRHRGRLTVTSTKGEGTTFTVFLPAAAEEPHRKIAV